MFHVDEMPVGRPSDGDQRFVKALRLGRELRGELDRDLRFQDGTVFFDRTEPPRDAHIPGRPVLQHFVVGPRDPQRQVRYGAVGDGDSQRRAERNPPESRARAM